MAALKWLTPRKRSATERSVLAGEAAAEAAESALAAGRQPPTRRRDHRPGGRAGRRQRHARIGARPVTDGEADQPGFPVPGDPRAAAFFDLDNTVMQGAALFHFGRGLYKRKFFAKRDLLRFAWQQAYFRLAGAEDPEHMQDARDSALSIVKGRRVEEITRIGEEIYDEYMAGKIWPGTRALAQAHLDAGQRVWLVTAAPVETATIIARRLGLTGALGTVAESVGGVYTGRLVGEPLHGPAKAEAVRALATAEDLDLSALRRVQRLRQRHPDALAGRPPVRHQPRQRRCAGTPARRAGGCATTAPAARPRRSASRRPRAWARSPAASLAGAAPPAAARTEPPRPCRPDEWPEPRRRPQYPVHPRDRSARHAVPTRTQHALRTTNSRAEVVNSARAFDNWSIAISRDRKRRKRRFEQLGVASPVRSVILLRRIPVPTRRHGG